MAPMHWLQRVAAAAVALLALAGCDEQRIRELQPGISTEADVRERFGVPDRVWPEDDGSQTLEYDRQPAGRTNYMITIGPDGRMSAYAQVLTPQHFARVQPGMHEDQVRRLLGRPAKRATYELKQQTEWDWYWNDGPGREMAFTVVFDASGRVLRSGSGERLHEGP